MLTPINEEGAREPMIAEALVIAAIAGVGYIYAGYPIALALLSRLFRRLFETGGHEPTVVLVIAAHNEERVIRQKLENSLALDYPRDKLTIAVASDASTDATNAIVAEYADRGVALFDIRERGGKIAALNQVVPQLTSEIIVMSDANGMYDPAAIRALVRRFADPRVGCVCGELRYGNPSGAEAGRGEGAYWRYEVAIKKMESDMGTLLGANGGIFAYRRDLREPVPPIMANDFVTPVLIALKGYAVVYEPGAICYERASTTVANEFRRHSRFAARGVIAGLWLLGKALRRGHAAMIFELVSHRLLRWCSGLLLIVALTANLFARDGLFGWLLALQLAGYAAALLGWALARAGRPFKPLIFPYYFLTLNLAGLNGLWRLATGRTRAHWSTKER